MKAKQLSKASGNELSEARSAIGEALNLLERDYFHVNEYTKTVIDAAKKLQTKIEKEVNLRENY